MPRPGTRLSLHLLVPPRSRASGFSADGEGFCQEELLELGGSPGPILQSCASIKREAFLGPSRVQRQVLDPHRSDPPAASRSACVGADDLALLSSFPLRQFVFKGRLPDLSKAGALDLFSGAGGVARSLVRHGCPWVLTFDSQRSVSEDLTDSALRQSLLALVERGVFLVVGASPPCSSVSRAAALPARSASRPEGLRHLAPSLFAKVSRDNLLGAWLLQVQASAGCAGARFWFENPDSSFLWRLPGWEAFSAPHSPHVFRLDRCRCGCPWRKRTRIATNCSLAGARLLCPGAGHHRLRGYSKAHRKPWTLVAQPFPRGLCELLALALCAAAGWTQDRPLDAAACAKLPLCCRIGEASHPGPRRPSRRPPVPGGLSGAPLHSAASSRLGFLAWTSFLKWVRRWISSSDPVSSFVVCPPLLAMALRVYGDHLYQTGGSLQNFRYTVVAAQRLSWGMKGQLGPAWEMVSRWEKLQPTVHRTPVPEILVRAMVALAWGMNLRRWATVTLLAFYGLARIGEVIKTRRSSLLLPRDHMGGFCAIFVKLEGQRRLRGEALERSICASISRRLSSWSAPPWLDWIGTNLYILLALVLTDGAGTTCCALWASTAAS